MRAVPAAPRDLLAGADRATADAAERESPDVRRGVEVRHERLQRQLGVIDGRRYVLEERLEERFAGSPPQARPARTRGLLDLHVRCSR